MSEAYAYEVMEAMKAAVTRAGFVNAQGRVIREEFERILVRADCPCGLGTSGFSYALSPFPDRWELQYVDDRFYKLALDHIEEDKREGRWK
jgi:hypothetical protein